MPRQTSTIQYLTSGFSNVLIKVVGIDPSLTATGLAKGTYDTITGELKITELLLVETQAQTGKTVRRNSDDMRRSSDIARTVHAFLKGAHVAFAEIPTGSQSARANLAFGVCIGIMSTVGIVGEFRGRLIQVLPQEVKKAFTGSKNAAKEEMIDEARRRWPDAPWMTRKLKGQIVPVAKNEHLADACAAINAGIKTDEFLSVVQMTAGIVNEDISPASK
jgi:Holliday junction resolvasome RuvABC endonuclease subunit